MRFRNVLAIAIGAGAVGFSEPALAATPVSAGQRPHARVVTYAHGVRVTMLQLAVRRVGHRIRGRVTVSASSTTGRATNRTLRVGRCRRGTTVAPFCPAALSLAVRIPATGSVTLSRPIALRQPDGHLDAVEARLVEAGAPVRQPFHHSDAELLLRGRAWRGATAGHAYGVVLSSNADASVGRISVDGPAVRPDELYADVVYTATGTALGAPVTTLLRSPPPAADLGTVLQNRRGAGAEDFRDRFDVEQRGASAFGVQVRGGGHLLARVLLPWPTNP